MSPKKCWGKKVRLTPIKVLINCVFNKVLFIITPVIKGYQLINLAIIANTAPIDRT